MHTIHFDFEDEEDENGECVDLSFDAPASWVICYECRGEGASSAYLGAYTGSEMDEAGPEFREEYMAGRYDRTCECCKGSGKTLEVTWNALTPAQQKLISEREQMLSDMYAMEEAERRAGC